VIVILQQKFQKIQFFLIPFKNNMHFVPATEGENGG